MIGTPVDAKYELERDGARVCGANMVAMIGKSSRRGKFLVEFEFYTCIVTQYALQYSQGVDNMEKTATLNLRVNPEVKKSAEMILSQLGVPMATAIDIFLKQITLTGGIPFTVTLPKLPESINADMMTTAQIQHKLNEGLSNIESGNERPAGDAFAQFRKGRSK